MARSWRVKGGTMRRTFMRLLRLDDLSASYTNGGGPGGARRADEVQLYVQAFIRTAAMECGTQVIRRSELGRRRRECHFQWPDPAHRFKGSLKNWTGLDLDWFVDRASSGPASFAPRSRHMMARWPIRARRCSPQLLRRSRAAGSPWAPSSATRTSARRMRLRRRVRVGRVSGHARGVRALCGRHEARAAARLVASAICASGSPRRGRELDRRGRVLRVAFRARRAPGPAADRSRVGIRRTRAPGGALPVG